MPEDAAPGSSKVTVKCPPRIRMTDTVEITRRPSGPVAAGLGGAADTDGSRIALGGLGGLGGLLVAGAAVGGAVKARRRLRLGRRCPPGPGVGARGAPPAPPAPGPECPSKTAEA
ncbi:hypothetical protein AB0442_17135 [Kitasatospora sp. NPDC085895]|uniref:hypothetical protein n=1 Tax=Kitasatospora sp. NPDC085895 TaxID=3155057 RepID=UPI00344CA0F0